MDSSVVVNRASLRAALKYWHQLTELGKCDLARLEIVREKITDEPDNTPVNRGLILRGEMQTALAEMQQIYMLATGEENTYYTLLSERYVGCRPVDVVKDSLGIEKTEFYRRQNAAYDAMASILNSRELRRRSELSKSVQAHVTQAETKLVFQVPRPITEHMVGRNHLLRVIKERLTPGRTTVLLGIPGIGKTSLAIALANDPETLDHFNGGILWANLGASPDPLAVLRRWGHTLGVAVEVINKATKEVLSQSIHDRIGARPYMIIVDDVWDIEQAILLRVGGPNCHHLYTTRLLQIALSLADANGPLRIEELSLGDSITLLSQFVDERTLSAFDISLESLAKASGGLPLALMLAGCLLSQAMHSGMMQRFRKLLLALQDPAQRMMLSIPVGPNDAGNNSAGQLSVYTQIAGTEQVLSDEARRALADLGVFLPKPHSFPSDAALSVGNCTIDAIDELVGFGLLETLPGDRFTLHQSISEYARMRLSDDDAWHRMVRWYAEYAEINENNYIALDAEWDNMQYAFGVAQERHFGTELLRAAHAIPSFLLSRNMSERAYDLLSTTLSESREDGSPARMARHLILLARTALHAKAYQEASTAIHEALHLIDTNSEATQQLPTAYEIAAMVANALGKTEEALEWYARAMEAAQATQQISLIPRMLVNMERLDIDTSINSQIAASAMKPPPALQKVLGKAKSLLRIQPKILASPGLRAWIKGVRLAFKGDTQGATVALQRGIADARDAKDPAALITVLGFYSQVCVGIGDYINAERCAIEGLSLKSTALFPRSVGFLYSSYAQASLYHGDIAKAHTILNEGLAYAIANNHPESESWLKAVAGIVWLAQGDANTAYQVAFDGIAQSQRIGVIDMQSYSTALCGLALAHLHEYEKAWPYLKESVTDVAAMPNVWGTAFGWISYGEGQLMAGNIAAARDNLRRGYELSTNISSIPYAARALFGLAKVAIVERDRSAALDYANQSYNGFTRIGDVRAQEVSQWVRDQLGAVAGSE